MLGASPKSRKGAPVKLGSMKEAPAAVAAVATGGGNGGKVPAEEVWEVRPGGMLVQKRGGGGGAGDDEPSPNVKPVPTIRVKVKHAGVTHEIYISSEASFGQSSTRSFLLSVRSRRPPANHLADEAPACCVQGS
jgi:hypothetical protein